MKYKVDVIVVVAAIEDDDHGIDASKAIWTRSRSISQLDGTNSIVDALKFVLRQLRDGDSLMTLADAITKSERGR